MNEISRIPWGKVFSNFIWILGASMILAVFSYHEFLAHLKKAKRTEVFKRNSFKKPFILGLVLIALGISASSLLHIFSVPPEAIILKDTVKFSPSSLEGDKTINGDIIFMASSGAITSKIIQFEKSKYEIQITSKGSRALGETARLRVFVGINLIADYFTSTEYEEKVIEFKSKKKQLKRLIIEFCNDYYDPENNLDRNVWIKSVGIIKN